MMQALNNLQQLGHINFLKTNRDLLSYKKNKICLILGNGPSSKKYLQSNIFNNVDTIGFSYISLTQYTPNYYFFEPLTIANENYRQWSGYLNRQIALYKLRDMQVNELKKDKYEESLVLLNPQFCTDSLGFWEQGSNLKLCMPKYHIVNESTELKILKGIKNQLNMTDHLLNLRGSMIRAVSLAIFLGYEEIWISGNDPASTIIGITTRNY